jgi:enoyl-CoA hydratase
MSEPVTYELRDGVATVRMDDGKVNALSRTMLAGIGAALDKAEADEAVVVLTGRPGIFSAGFDLRVLRGGGEDAVAMLQEGFLLAERLLSHPRPVVVACPGHAIAMASFLLLSPDYRIGVTGEFRITANEVAIGLVMPRAAVELCRQRLAPAYFHRAVVLAEVFSPEQAVAAGFLDAVVAPEDLEEAAGDAGRRLAELHMTAHRVTKERARALSLERLRAAVEQDDAEMAGGLGIEA